MPTNHLLSVQFSEGVLKIGSRDAMGSLTDLFMMGNQYRAKSGKAIARPDLYMELASTKDYIKHLKEVEGIEEPVRTKKGKGGGTWAHMYVLIDAAMYLSPALKTEVIKMFVHSKLLQHRNDASDKFIDLNASVALHAEAVFGKPSHSGHYITLAKTIKARVLDEGQEWNNAEPERLFERTRIEEGLANMLRLGLVRDWDHLKELAEKV